MLFVYVLLIDEIASLIFDRKKSKHSGISNNNNSNETRRNTLLSTCTQFDGAILFRFSLSVLSSCSFFSCFFDKKKKYCSLYYTYTVYRYGITLCIVYLCSFCEKNSSEDWKTSLCMHTYWKTVFFFFHSFIHLILYALLIIGIFLYISLESTQNPKEKKTKKEKKVCCFFLYTYEIGRKDRKYMLSL